MAKFASGEMWRVPLEAGFFELRVVLRVADLALPRGSPLSFVGECALVQVATPNTLFDSTRLLSPGCFLLIEPRRFKSLGWSHRGRSSVGVADIEPPIVLVLTMVDSTMQALVNRGEIDRRLSIDDPDSFLDRHHILLTPMTGVGLAAVVREAAGSSRAPRSGFARSDLRLSEEGQSILRLARIDWSKAYLDELLDLEPDRVPSYRKAISGGSDRAIRKS